MTGGPDALNTSTLIIVACHAVFREGCTTPERVELDSSREGGYPGEGKFYRDHVKAGVVRAAGIPDSRIYFSGAATQSRLAGRAEGRSYWEVARDHGWWGHTEVEARAFYECSARDSFENLLYSIAAFRRDTGGWPDQLIVVGWEFKARRFDLHRAAIKWPREKFEYCGVNNPAGEALAKAVHSEAALVAAVQRDLYLMGPEFVSKRELRSPFHTRHSYRGIDPALDRFFDFLDSTSFRGDIPWLK